MFRGSSGNKAKLLKFLTLLYRHSAKKKDIRETYLVTKIKWKEKYLVIPLPPVEMERKMYTNAIRLGPKIV